MRMRGALGARLLFLVAACLVLAAAFVWGFSFQREEPVRSVQFMMDTVVEQSLTGKNAQSTAQEAETLLRTLDNSLSLFHSASEVGRINAAAGIEPVAVDETAFRLLKQSVEFGRASNGDFDITTAPLKLLWSITGENPRVPEQSEVEALLPLVGYGEIVLNEQKQTVFLPRTGQEVDLGGVAKGYAAGRCLALYKQRGISGYISVGGNVAVSGLGADGKPMRFGIRAPRGDAGYIGYLELTDTVLATSGDYERFFEADGVRYHHILNPRTGYPAQSGLISVSVVCADGATADFLSTTLFLRGRQGLDSLRGVYAYEYVAVDSNYNIYVSAGLKNVFHQNPQALEYHLIS